MRYSRDFSHDHNTFFSANNNETDSLDAFQTTEIQTFWAFHNLQRFITQLIYTTSTYNIQNGRSWSRSFS